MSWLTSILRTAGVPLPRIDSLTMRGLAVGVTAFVVSKVAPFVDMEVARVVVDNAATGLAIIGAAMTAKGYERRKAMPAEDPSLPSEVFSPEARFLK